MKINYYKIIEDIIDSGIEGGWNRAHKHSDNPAEETIKSCIHEYITNGFSETFDFDKEE